MEQGQTDTKRSLEERSTSLDFGKVKNGLAGDERAVLVIAIIPLFTCCKES